MAVRDSLVPSRTPSGNMRSGAAITYTLRFLCEITLIKNGYTFSPVAYPPRPDVPSRLITHWPHFDSLRAVIFHDT